MENVSLIFVVADSTLKNQAIPVGVSVVIAGTITISALDPVKRILYIISIQTITRNYITPGMYCQGLITN